MKKIITIATLSVATLLFGCQSAVQINEESKHKPLLEKTKKDLHPKRSAFYFRPITPNEELIAMKVPDYAASNEPLVTVLNDLLPEVTAVPLDSSVDITMPVSVAGKNMTVRDYIDFLENQTKYEIKYDGKRLTVAGFVTKQWKFDAFAATRSVDNSFASVQKGSSGSEDSGGTSSNSATYIASSHNGDEFQQLIDAGNEIIWSQIEDNNAESSDSTTTDNNSSEEVDGGDIFKPFIHGIRSVGIITAGGSPEVMRMLDEAFQAAIDQSVQQVHIELRAYDVTLGDEKSRGIDWSVLNNASVNGNPFNLAFNGEGGSLDSGIIDSSLFNFSGAYTSSKTQANFLVNFLSNYGEVRLMNQPNLTLRHGVPAQIYTGDEFSMVVDFEQTQDANGIVTLSPRLNRQKVGVTLSLTARVLDDERILLDVWPVLSAVNGAENIEVGGTIFKIPTLSLTELTTQVIVPSGQSIHLGGLIYSRLEEALKSIPGDPSWLEPLKSALSDQENNSLVRRELVMAITATIIDGGR